MATRKKSETSRSGVRPPEPVAKRTAEHMKKAGEHARAAATHARLAAHHSAKARKG